MTGFFYVNGGSSTDKKVMKVQIATIRVQGVTHQTEISGGFITSCVMILL